MEPKKRMTALPLNENLCLLDGGTFHDFTFLSFYCIVKSRLFVGIRRAHTYAHQWTWMMRFLRDSLTQSAGERATRVKATRVKVNYVALINKRFWQNHFVWHLMLLAHQKMISKQQQQQGQPQYRLLFYQRQIGVRLARSACVSVLLSTKRLTVCIVFIGMMCSENRKRFRHLFGRYTLTQFQILLVCRRWRLWRRRRRLFTRHTVRQQIFDYMLHAPLNVHGTHSHWLISCQCFPFVHFFFRTRFASNKCTHRHTNSHANVYNQEFAPVHF